MRRLKHKQLVIFLLILSLYPLSIHARPFVLVLSQDDLKDAAAPSEDEAGANAVPTDSEWDEFGESDTKTEEELDPGSWRPILEPDSSSSESEHEAGSYLSGVSRMLNAASNGEVRMMVEAASEIEAVATSGDPHSQSVMGLLYGSGLMRERDKAKAFLYHYFAAEGGNMQSKMALAYTYSRQDVSFFLTGL